MPERKLSFLPISASAVKNPGSEDQALVIPIGNLLCWKFIDILKFQKTNPKKNNRFEPVWNLEFEIYLEFGAWNL